MSSAHADKLVLYGVPFSQPVRAVLWTLLMKRVPFELKLVNPGSSGATGSKHSSYLEKNPAGTVPMLQDGDFVVSESHAIMGYLANKYGWDDLYPSEPRARAKVDNYLHYHHRSVREASVGLVAPNIRKDIVIPDAIKVVAVMRLTEALNALDNGWLKSSRYIAGDKLTIADLSCYVELGQLLPGFTNLKDFADYPNVQRWLQDMAKVPCHDDVHVVLAELGDISQGPPSKEAIKKANSAAVQRIQELSKQTALSAKL
eukprot:TRINITY_DN44428_c0_g1_i2.p1 TRINITY_DN44428_c0_g1~~TRINITY_DN44428_c0_g1_i2.p1  ORF type:complete len:258 (+),score=56.49 TRINITY_DN44428_c0_g1_i2:58-831(+)